METKELSFPFDSVLDENGQDDRLYYSEDFSRYFANFIGNGVYPNPSNGLKIMAKNGLVLTAKKGSGFINGYGYVLNEDLEIRLNIANASYIRKDIVVLRLDLIQRSINIFVKEGTPSASPSLPAIIRNSDIYELKLAEITIRAGIQTITQADILDTRLNNSVCGVVTSVVKSVDTEDLFEQYETYLNQKIAEWENRKNQQENDFRQQLNRQQEEFETQHNEIENWYNNTKVNISNEWENIKDSQENEFRQQVNQQKTEFRNQLNNQQEEFEIQHNEIEAWYTSVKLDITKLQTFDFDNLSSMQGATCQTIFNSDGSISEAIIIESSHKIVARRETTFLANGDIKEHIEIFERDGSTIMKEITINTMFDENGNITEVVR